jgi:hypothetical protein
MLRAEHPAALHDHLLLHSDRVVPSPGRDINLCEVTESSSVVGLEVFLEALGSWVANPAVFVATADSRR